MSVEQRPDATHDLSAEARAKLRSLGTRYGIRNIRVFGSFARGEQRAGSDLDLLVDYLPGQSGFAFFRFCEEAEQIVGTRVDVATERGLHPMIRARVLDEAVPL
jgi:predicted nucleotidyltransferase